MEVAKCLVAENLKNQMKLKCYTFITWTNDIQILAGHVTNDIQILEDHVTKDIQLLKDHVTSDIKILRNHVINDLQMLKELLCSWRY